MNKLNVLITGAGAPGIKGTLYSIKNNYDNRSINIIGTDMADNVVGKYICDGFYKIPPASKTDEYLNTLLKICNNEKIDVLIPQNTAELLILSKNKYLFQDHNILIVVSNPKSLELANNKYYLLNRCKELNIPYPEYYLVDNITSLTEFAKSLGYPEKRVIIKPPLSNGLRGFRVLDSNINLKHSFFNDKPTGIFTTLEDLKKILGDEFPSLLVTEYLPGDEYTVDVFRYNDIVKVIPRKRDLIKNGITFVGTAIEDDNINEYCKLLSENINLEYCFGFQFKLDEYGIPKILECNPRVQGTMVLSTFAGGNIIYDSIKALLGETIPLSNIQWETSIHRYWGGVGVCKNNKIIYL